MEHFSLQFDRNICKNPGPFFQCCMFKKEQLFDYKILFDHNAIPSEDWDFFINLSKLNPIIRSALVSEILSKVSLILLLSKKAFRTIVKIFL